MVFKEEVHRILRSFQQTLPTFPDGRIDFCTADTAPVLTIFVCYKQSMLLLKRSAKVSTYKQKWNTVAGYLDELKPLKEKILEELREETGIGNNDIASYHLGEPYTFTDELAKKTWIVHPVLVILNHKPTITLDWEHTEYRWIKPSELAKFDHVPQLKRSLSHVQQWLP